MKPTSAQLFVFCMALLFSFQLYRCISKYLEFEVIENKRTIEMDSNHFPMVTVTPTPGYKVTKPESFFEMSASIRDYCFREDINKDTNFTACIEEVMYQPWEMVEAVLYNQTPLPFEDVVVTPYSPLLVPLGRSFTFHYQEEVSGEGQRFTFKIHNMADFIVNPSLTFQFHVNGTYFPYVYLDAQNFDHRAEQRFTASKNKHGVVSVLLQKHYRMNTPKSPCIDEQDYTVLQCTERFVAESIGCVSPWTNIKTDIKTCQTETELDTLVKWQARLFQMSASDFARFTGCYQPCIKEEVELIRYTEIQFPYFADEANSFVIMLVSTSMIEIRETLIYDLNSLVGEIGGSLGLFLGMSLVQIYRTGLRLGKGLTSKKANMQKTVEAVLID